MNNPLQEYAHLFCNGKFRIEHQGLVDWVSIYTNGIIKAWDGHGYFEAKPENSTLIARPIDDMTDEELHSVGIYKKSLIEMAESESIDQWSFCRLLDMGVYPFDQSHFEDGTVIDSRTL